MKLVQRYGDFGLVPRILPDSCRSCCDRGKRLRQSRGRGLECVVKGYKNGLRCWGLLHFDVCEEFLAIVEICFVSSSFCHLSSLSRKLFCIKSFFIQKKVVSLCLEETKGSPDG